MQFISIKICIILLKDVCVKVSPWYSYSKIVLFYSVLIQFYLKLIFCTNYAICYSLQLITDMPSCDYAVCFEIFDVWNLLMLITDRFLMVFCTWDSNAHIILIYHRILLFSPHLVKNKPWLHFKSFIFVFLKEVALYMENKKKIDCTKLTPIF